VVTVPAEGAEKVTLRFVPDRVGKFTYRVVAPVMNGESISENNTRSYVARVIRDKIRVLHVVGRPSWDQRFLREVLKRNPNIDLVSFYILRMHLDVPGVSEQDLSQNLPANFRSIPISRVKRDTYKRTMSKLTHQYSGTAYIELPWEVNMLY
jgi:hypothetical protein